MFNKVYMLSDYHTKSTKTDRTNHCSVETFASAPEFWIALTFTIWNADNSIIRTLPKEVKLNQK